MLVCRHLSLLCIWPQKRPQLLDMNQLRIPGWLELAETLQDNILALMYVNCTLICKVPCWKRTINTPELLCLQENGHSEAALQANLTRWRWPAATAQAIEGELDSHRQRTFVAEPFLFCLVRLHLKQEWPGATGRIRAPSIQHDAAASEAAVPSLRPAPGRLPRELT